MKKAFTVCLKPQERVSPIQATLTSRCNSHFKRSNVSFKESELDDMVFSSNVPNLQRSKIGLVRMWQFLWFSAGCVGHIVILTGMNTPCYLKATYWLQKKGLDYFISLPSVKVWSILSPSLCFWLNRILNSTNDDLFESFYLYRDSYWSMVIRKANAKKAKT